MGIIIFGLLVLAIFLFMKDGNSFFKSIAIVAISFPIMCLLPMVAIPVIAIILVLTAKGY